MIADAAVGTFLATGLSMKLHGIGSEITRSLSWCVFSLAAAGCAKDDCSCFNPGLALSAPKGELTSVTVSGAACEGASVSCTDESHAKEVFVAGCEQYVISVTHAGACVVHLETKTLGAKDETRTFVDRRADDCCGGFYVSPDTAARITLPN